VGSVGSVDGAAGATVHQSAYVLRGGVCAMALRWLLPVLALACVPAALRLLGVRDWRCYGVALLGSPATACLKLGTLGPPMLLGIAVAWRLRDRRGGGAAIGFVIALKPFVWPLAAWGVLRRRSRHAVVAIAVAVGACLASWAAIGFAGLAEYPETLRAAARIWGPESFSPFALAAGAGAPKGVATAAALALALAVLVGGRRLRATGPAADAIGLTVCLAAAFLATPILWEHYLVLLLVPIALAAPTLSPVWFVPVVLEAARLPAWSHGEARHIVTLLAFAAVMVAWPLADLRRDA